jgi:hypothetical protein
MSNFNATFLALLKEAHFTKEMLGSGATQIRAANYAKKGTYLQAFTSLATGLERMGKLCLMLDHYIETGGNFPNQLQLKKEIGHKLLVLYEKSQHIIGRRSFSLRYGSQLSDPIHREIIQVLHDFAEGDRYSNINLLVGDQRTNDPIAAWFSKVDTQLYETRVSEKKKSLIAHNARVIGQLLDSHSYVLHTSEAGDEISDIENASVRTGIFEAVAPYRQLYVLQIIRYWAELISELEHLAHQLPGEDIPYFSELFGIFYNDDSYIRTRKTWDRI